MTIMMNDCIAREPTRERNHCLAANIKHFKAALTYVDFSEMSSGAFLSAKLKQSSAIGFCRLPKGEVLET